MTRTGRFWNPAGGGNHAIATADDEICDLNGFGKRGLGHFPIGAWQNLPRQQVGFAGNRVTGDQDGSALMGQQQTTAPCGHANRWEQVDVWGWALLGGHNLLECVEVTGQRLSVLVIAMFDRGIAF